ncbi:MAG: M6 family metalloprotease domain-containing protein [Bacteroidales bacterium]|nr:M6 family metalloprotease domain-containing protein [Bacteroidales bacterium]
MIARKIVFFATWLFALMSSAQYLHHVPQEIMLPDGSRLSCYASGDAIHHYLHDAEGYVLIDSKEDGYFYYAIHASDSTWIPSEWKAGTVRPSEVGLTPHLRLSDKQLQARYEAMKIPEYVPDPAFAEVRTRSGERLHEGVLNNLVVFVRFSDDPAFRHSKLDYEEIFHGARSLRSYYDAVSYQKLNIQSHFFPINTVDSITRTYTDYHPRSFYKKYNALTSPDGYKTQAEANQRRFGLLQNALKSVKGSIPADLVLDKNQDGKMDLLSFIIQGSPEGWSDLIWPHRFYLNGQGGDVYINGALAYDYTFQLENYGNLVDVLTHETFHALSAPDLYRYNSAETPFEPVGVWDLMGSGNSHMGAYMKYRYSNATWIESLPGITKSGRYSLNPLSSSTNNVYKIVDPASTSSSYFVLEYRKKDDAFERGLPGSGLLVYRINPNYKGNAQGPPDEVYLFRPDGTATINGKIASAAAAGQSGLVWGGEFNPLFFENGKASGIRISNISVAGAQISFDVELEKSAEAMIDTYYLSGNNSIVINKSMRRIYGTVGVSESLADKKPIVFPSDGATIFPKSGALVDLSNPFTYTVTAANGSTADWLVLMDRVVDRDANILSAQLPHFEEADVRLDAAQSRVDIRLPSGADLSDLQLGLLASNGASISPDPYDVRDYRAPVRFTVTSEIARISPENDVPSAEHQKEWEVWVQTATDLNPIVEATAHRTVLRNQGRLRIQSDRDIDARVYVLTPTGQKVAQGRMLGTELTFVSLSQPVLLVVIESVYGREVFKAIEYR